MGFNLVTILRDSGARMLITWTEAELVDHVRTRIAAYKYPRSVEFRDSLPKDAAGKIVKRELQSWTA